MAAQALALTLKSLERSMRTRAAAPTPIPFTAADAERWANLLERAANVADRIGILVDDL